MTSERERLLLSLIHLMRQELAALRSVLSEWDEDKTCYVQFCRAEALAAAVDCLIKDL